MTDNSQAAHEAAWDYAGSVVCQLMLDPNFNGGFGQETCRAYHEHMLAHTRPQIEAAAREAALREALESVRDEHLQDPPHDDPTDIAYDKAVTHCAQAISALIEKEPTNAG